MEREREGPQSTEGSRETPAHPNVVRLGDWIGPRDELVPFARRKGYRVREESSELGTAERVEPDPALDPPPSANAFWGEGAAAIHDPVEAPPGAADRAPAPRIRRRRRARLAGVACVAAATLIGLAMTLNLFVAGTPQVGGQRIPLASVLSSRVPRILSLGLSRIQPTAASTSRLVAVRRRVRRPAPQPHPVAETVHYIAPARDTTASSAPAVTNDSATQHASAPPPPSTNRSTSSSAPVSPTGESGALGPIQSPNG